MTTIKRKIEIEITYVYVSVREYVKLWKNISAAEK